MAAGKLGDEKQELPEHKLVNSKNKGGLQKVTAEFFEICCIAEQIFKKYTETCSNKIDGQLITKAVLEDTGVLANFSKLKSNINYADNEITENILEDLIHLYRKTRTFSLVRNKMDAHKTKPGHLEHESKNHVTSRQAPETSLEGYKNTYFDS